EQVAFESSEPAEEPTSYDQQDEDLRALEQSQPARVPPVQVEQPAEAWQPSAEEAAELERQQAAEAAADQQRASAPRSRG
ncbi:hypothetical protein O6379_24365, partial [Salmonella enterica subsp. enterica]|nr:hypothetical protein [Salmonella enterica]